MTKKIEIVRAFFPYDYFDESGDELREVSALMSQKGLQIGCNPVYDSKDDDPDCGIDGFVLECEAGETANMEEPKLEEFFSGLAEQYTPAGFEVTTLNGEVYWFQAE